MRILDPAHLSNLTKCTRRTTLQITFGGGVQMNLATSDIEFGNLVFLGKLSADSELNLDALDSSDAVALKISNVALNLGQTLINTADILSGTDAVLGCYFKNLQTGAEWHDVKLTGKITVGKITRRWINILFESITSAIVYEGQSIAELFPDAEIPTSEVPTATTAPMPAYNDIENVPDSAAMRKLSPFMEDNQYGGRYYLPDFQLQEY